MSAAPARQQRAYARPGAAAPTERRHLRPVQAPETQRSLVPFAAACLAIVLAALAAVLLINTAMAEGAYERRDLKIQVAQLHKQRATLLETLEANASPSVLASAAESLGMERAGSLGAVSLADGIVLETGK